MLLLYVASEVQIECFCLFCCSDLNRLNRQISPKHSSRNIKSHCLRFQPQRQFKLSLTKRQILAMIIVIDRDREHNHVHIQGHGLDQEIVRRDQRASIDIIGENEGAKQLNIINKNIIWQTLKQNI